MNLSKALNRSREKAVQYLMSMGYETERAFYWRHSPIHDVKSHPSHLLYGTWSGALASVLIGLDHKFSTERLAKIEQALNDFQRRDGTFFMPGVLIENGSVSGHTDEYLALHCTNYAIGALRALSLSPRYHLRFMVNYPKNSREVWNWLDARDWNAPWR